jgi:hypothetical protein
MISSSGEVGVTGGDAFCRSATYPLVLGVVLRHVAPKNPVHVRMESHCALGVKDHARFVVILGGKTLQDASILPSTRECVRVREMPDAFFIFVSESGKGPKLFESKYHYFLYCRA